MFHQTEDEIRNHKTKHKKKQDRRNICYILTFSEDEDLVKQDLAYDFGSFFYK